MTAEDTPRKAGRSAAGAIVVGVFLWIVFDNLALALIFGLLAAGAIGSRTRKGSTVHQSHRAGEAQPNDDCC